LQKGEFMDREQAKQEIKQRFAEYLQPARIVNGKQSYVCPLCGNGTGQDADGLLVIPNGDGTTLKCFKCSESGDIFHFYMQQHGCDFKEAFTALCDRFGLVVDGKADPQRQRTAPQPVQSTPAAQPLPNFADYYSKVCNYTELPEIATSYLQGRGISTETAKQFHMGFDNGFVIIPVSNSFYIARNTDSTAEFRYKNPKSAPVELFNAAALYNEAGKPVFITEGTFDALSIIETGAQAVALNSTSNYRKLLQILKEKKTSNVLIICMDKDETGEKTTEQLCAGLRELNIKHVTADISGQHKDANEALTADKKTFTAAVRAAQRNTCKPDNIFDYLRTGFTKEAAALKAQANRKTGFENLDRECGSIYAGLYVVGGISSVGKTTFISQMADQMAAQGEHVLFFTMEQSRLEMASKSLARATAKLDMPTALTSLQIRTGQENNTLAEAVQEYVKSVADRLSIIEGNFDSTVSYIKEYTEQYIERNNVKPVVIVDYLQVMQAEKDPETGRKPTDTKQITDYNITQLKRMSRALELPVIVVSSVNRSNYLTPIDFESFKESGGIEYTADVVWGLQLSVLQDDIFSKDSKLAEKREKVAEAKEKTPRDIELVCLKNRYGKSRYAVRFTYYPQHDYYMPAESPEQSPGINLSEYNIK